MAGLFLDEFFPSSQASNIQKEISGITQNNNETLHMYWTRFKKLCASCPQHGFSEQLLIQYFYEGLTSIERRLMDATSSGAIVNKTPTEARRLITTMAATSQQREHFKIHPILKTFMRYVIHLLKINLKI